MFRPTVAVHHREKSAPRVLGASLACLLAWGCAEQAPPTEPLRPVRTLQVFSTGAERVRSFSGTARYSTKFRLTSPAAANEWVLDLGAVHESARVILNGRVAGTIFCHPYKLRVGGRLRPGTNSLEIEVTNLAANRVIHLDRTMVKWKKFHDINFVNVDYLPFNAASWAYFDSGLGGPVRLFSYGD